MSKIPLTTQQIRELLKSGHESQSRIAKAVRHESQLKLYSSFYQSEGEARAAGADIDGFMQRWKAILNKDDKFALFQSMFTFPVATVPFVGKLWQTFEKIFHGIDPVFHYEFLTPELAQEDAEKRQWKSPLSFTKRMFHAAQSGAINCLIVADLPEVQETERPEPNIYLKPIGEFVAYDFEGDSNRMEWACFKVGDERLAFFDCFTWRVFPLKKGTNELIGEALIEAPHGLVNTDGSPCCPVQFMWTDAISPNEPDMKASPLSKWLTELFWLLGFKVSERNNDLVALWPIYWMYETPCDYSDTNEERGISVQCENGILRTGDGAWLYDRDGGNQKCPKCGTRSIIGPGSLIEKPAPTPGEPGGYEPGAPVGVVPAESTSIELVRSKIEGISKEVSIGVTGVEPDSLNKQAVNADQIGKAVDAMLTAILNLKHNLETAHEWSERVRCQLAYGADYFKGVTCNLGTRFIFLTPEDLFKVYNDARVSGADATILDRLWDDWNAAKRQKNPVAMERAKVLMHLDPFRHRTADEVQKLGMVDPVLLYLKFNFSSLIARFEREYGTIESYGIPLDLSTRIDIIQKTLIDYVKGAIKIDATADPNGKENGQASGTAGLPSGQPE